MKENAIDYTEDGGCARDAEDDGQQRDDRESGTRAQHAQAVANVLDDRVHQSIFAQRNDRIDIASAVRGQLASDLRA